MGPYVSEGAAAHTLAQGGDRVVGLAAEKEGGALLPASLRWRKTRREGDPTQRAVTAPTGRACYAGMCPRYRVRGCAQGAPTSANNRHVAHDGKTVTRERAGRKRGGRGSGTGGTGRSTAVASRVHARPPLALPQRAVVHYDSSPARQCMNKTVREGRGGKGRGGEGGEGRGTRHGTGATATATTCADAHAEHSYAELPPRPAATLSGRVTRGCGRRCSRGRASPRQRRAVARAHQRLRSQRVTAPAPVTAPAVRAPRDAASGDAGQVRRRRNTPSSGDDTANAACRRAAVGGYPPPSP